MKQGVVERTDMGADKGCVDFPLFEPRASRSVISDEPRNASSPSRSRILCTASAIIFAELEDVTESR